MCSNPPPSDKDLRARAETWHQNRALRQEEDRDRWSFMTRLAGVARRLVPVAARA